MTGTAMNPVGSMNRRRNITTAITATNRTALNVSRSARGTINPAIQRARHRESLFGLQHQLIRDQQQYAEEQRRQSHHRRVSQPAQIDVLRLEKRGYHRTVKGSV